ncbi:MAG: PAS domain S-box protein [Verrucomicrobiales bacterium]|nr:PAS domain S-box protein [Verrucomicrobiales bacterium]
MESAEDQNFPVPHTLHSELTPAPDRVRGLWRVRLEKIMGDDPEERWGGRLIRVASDMIVVCDGELNILFHNRAFLKGVGYQSGTFTGRSLMEFFPYDDHAEAFRAFDGLREGPQAGLRINATFLTSNGNRQFDARVTRSRVKGGGMHLYLIARESLKQEVTKPVRIETAPIDPILNGLPLAAFRTDRKLKVTHVCGSLWDELGFDAKQLIGGDLSNTQCHMIPHFLHELDFCDTMAGLTMHSDLKWKDESYEITVEPFINDSRKVIGTVGMIRKAKQVPEATGAEHLQFPSPNDYTQALKPMGVHHTHQKTRKIEIGPPQVATAENEVRIDEEDHRNIPAAMTAPVAPPLPVPKPVGSLRKRPRSSELIEDEVSDEADGLEPEGSEITAKVEPAPEAGENTSSMRSIEIGPPSMLTVPISPVPPPAGVRKIEIGPLQPSDGFREIPEATAEAALAPFESITDEAEEVEEITGGSNDIEVIRSKIQPRRLSPSDVLNGSDDEAADDPIVLAN